MGPSEEPKQNPLCTFGSPRFSFMITVDFRTHLDSGYLTPTWMSTWMKKSRLSSGPLTPFAVTGLRRFAISFRTLPHL